MNRCILSLALLAAFAGIAQAHFIFIVPADSNTATMIFSENLEADNPALLSRIAKTKVFHRNIQGKEKALTAKQTDEGFIIEATGDGPHTIGGVCEYGVLQRGQSKPFLLNYYAKAVLGNPKFYKPWGKLPLDIVPSVSLDGLRFQVLYKGKPAKGVEVVVYLGESKGAEFKTDVKGEVFVKDAPAGQYGARAVYIEPVSGKLDGKSYDEIRHYSTLALNTRPPKPEKVASVADAKESKGGEDPAASRLLKEARAARAQWPNFSGFTADLEVNLDGQITEGQVQVDARGSITAVGFDRTSQMFIKRTLGSIVAHRIDGSAELNSPCMFVDDVENHPLGRAIRVLSDEMHSSYRVKDRQITVVNRELAHGRFSITVLENKLSEEGAFLPSTFVVHFWDGQGKLTQTQSHAQTWGRIGTYDLPATVVIISDTKKLSARSMKLSNHKLLNVAAK